LMSDSWIPPAEPSHAANEGGVRSGSRFRRNRVTLLLAVVIVALAAVAGWALYAMHENGTRARSWERRAAVLQKDESQLQSLLGARTRLLNQRIDQVNSLATKLQRSQAALGQSQGDVSSLEVRQRELANQKAQLQDQQAALHQVVNSYVTCQDDLVQVVSDLANSIDATYDFQTADSDCSAANNGFQSYLNNWPNG
jgi:TolA-binding protein